MENANNEPDENSGPSKSQLKREMTALQDLGAELATLSKARLANIKGSIKDFRLELDY